MSRKRESAIPCRYFLLGTCSYGENCRFIHDVESCCEYYSLQKCATLGCTTYSPYELCKPCYYIANSWFCSTESCENRIQKGNYCQDCYDAWKKAQGPRLCHGPGKTSKDICGATLTNPNTKYCKDCKATYDRYVY